MEDGSAPVEADENEKNVEPMEVNFNKEGGVDLTDAENTVKSNCDGKGAWL